MENISTPQAVPAKIQSEAESVTLPAKQIHSTPSSLSGKYQFIRKIGEGSQAKVFLAKRLSDNQDVAIKQLDIDSVSNWKEYELFHREAAILSSLNIQGVARFYEAIECLEDTPPCSYLVQEYIEGESLAAMLKAGHRFSTDEVYDIIIQMLSILGQLQSQPVPVIHRDIKPSNLMLTPKDGGYRVTLIDFGAVANPQVQSGGSTVAGTYGYMPPEQLMGKPTPASDIYSLAAVAVELFSGKSPAILPTKDFRLIFEPEMQSQPPELVNTLRKMLEPDAKDRLCDLRKLYGLFTDYRQGKFKHAGEPSREDRLFNQKLAEVCDIGAPGNIELWQKLQDEPVREVPDIINHLGEANTPTVLSRSAPSAWLWFLIAWLWLVVAGFISTFVYPVPFLIIFAVFSGMIVLSLLFLVNQLTSNNRMDKQNDIPGSVDSSTFGMIELSLHFLVNQLTSNNRVDKQNDIPGSVDSSTALETKAISADDSMTLQDLISTGRKTIATIVNVEYLPANEQNCLVNAYVNHQNCLAYCDACVINCEPNFRIQYKFNPPDDMRNEDLIHSCIVHTEPENFYKIGDPLPILYRIKGEFFDEKVFSCPFPFSFGNSSEDEILYMSSAGAEFDNYCQKLKTNTLDHADEVSLNHLILTAKLVPQKFGDALRQYMVASLEARKYVIELCQLFLNSDRFIEHHPKYLSYLLSQINTFRFRDDVSRIVIAYLNRLKSGNGNIGVINVLMRSPYYYKMSEIWDCLYELCAYSEIREIVVAEIVNRYCGRLSDRFFEDDHYVDMHASLICSMINYYNSEDSEPKDYIDPESVLVNAFQKRPIQSQIWNQVLNTCQKNSKIGLEWLRNHRLSNAFLDIYRDLAGREPQSLSHEDRLLMNHFENLIAPFEPGSMKSMLYDYRYEKLLFMGIRCLVWRLKKMSDDELCCFNPRVIGKFPLSKADLYKIRINPHPDMSLMLAKLRHSEVGEVFCDFVRQIRNNQSFDPEIIEAIDIFGSYKMDGDLDKLFDVLLNLNDASEVYSKYPDFPVYMNRNSGKC